MTLFDSYCKDGERAGVWVLHSSGKSWGELLTKTGSRSRFIVD